MAKRALITGITGQDGAYLAKLLLEKGYHVIGAVRWSSRPDFPRLEELGIAQDIEKTSLDLLEFSNIASVIESTRPDEIYNLAAQSFVGLSFEQPLYVAECNALGVTRLLEAIRQTNDQIRFYQASTSEMFGKVREMPQNEETPFHPRSPYGVSKVYGHWITVNYQESYGLHASSGILFNHESPLRGMEFVTRKITLQLAQIKHGQREFMELGNLDARRDWGFAGDYVTGMWSMLQAETPGVYILASGETRQVREFLTEAATWFGFALEFEGQGANEVAIDRKTGRTIVKVNPAYYRPAEVDCLLGDPSKAERKLKWKRKVSFHELATMMAESDDRRVREDRVFF